MNPMKISHPYFAATIVCLYCSLLVGCAGFRDSLVQQARASALQVANARADALAERVEGRIRERVGEELQTRGVDAEQLRQQAREIAQANGIDLEDVRKEFREDVRQEGAEIAAAVVNDVFGDKTTAEFKQDIVNDAAESGKSSALNAIAVKYGPALAKVGGMRVAEAVGLSTPVGAGILGGLWLFGKARRRRKEDVPTVENVGGKTAPA